MDPWTAIAIIAGAIGAVYIIGSIGALLFIRKIWKDLF